jgi:hypothetical protein
MDSRAQTQGHRFLKPKESRPVSGPLTLFSAPQRPTSGSHILLSRPLIVFSGPRRPLQNFNQNKISKVNAVVYFLRIKSLYTDF